MIPGNKGCYTVGPQSKTPNDEVMAWYDNLPENYRKVLQDAPIRYSLKGLIPIWFLEQVIEERKQLNIFLAYGPEHPQLNWV